MGPLKLNSKNLSEITAAATAAGVVPIEIPTFPRGNAVKEGIVHIGVGGFHRAHLAVYVHELMQKHGVTDYAICGVGLQPFDAAMRDALGSQDHLYTIVERSAQGSVAKVMGGINSYLFAPDNREAVIAKMAHPDTHIVSLTITESGYYYNENTHELQSEDPDIQHDLNPANEPKTTFGFLYHGMARRHQQGLKPFTVVSCDNMQGNGAITRRMLVSFARLRDPKLAEWINTNGHFPNAMVDRITPQTSAADKVGLAKDFGIEDSWPIVTEPFMQWVIEDHFCDGRPPFEKVGVQIVKNLKNVEEFEKHKLRLLNGSHAIIAYGGQLAGYKYVHEVMENPLFRKFVWQMMQEEVKPTLPEISGHDTDKYCETLVERFSNPRSWTSCPVFAAVELAIWATGPFRRLCFTAAAWFHYINGVDDNGNKFEVQDPMLEEIQTKARAGGTNPMELLSIKSLFGDDLRNDKRFVDTITTALKDISRDGVIKSLPKYID
ncbi:hypothetical protein N7476_007699 [Penicillium atrosanguineum]|uniref:Mannitol 2-dehydrogenase n=1 Tax=Penicillium atrosanguineum TaxID=1132637 RepID=A0A9W9PV13_9EURO|nr:hypothetical protein N7476_007699 [Penicillium atrosanguineum]